MTYILITIAVTLVVGAGLILLTAGGSVKERARKVGTVAGVSLLASSIVAIVAGILAFSLMAGIESSIEDAFAGDEISTSEEDGWIDDEATWVCGTDDAMTKEEWDESECGQAAVGQPIGVDCSTLEGYESANSEYPCLPGQDMNALATLVGDDFDPATVDWSLYCTNGEDDRLCGNDESDIVN